MRRILPLIVLLSLAFAPAPLPRVAKPTPAVTELKAMQGRWDRTSGSVGEAELTSREANIRIAADKVVFFLGNQRRDEWSISLKPEKDAKRFEAKIISGDLKGRTASGTYNQRGDVLILTYVVSVQEGLFGAASAQPLVVLTYRRKKP